MTLTLYAFTCGWFNAPTGFFLEGARRRSCAPRSRLT